MAAKVTWLRTAAPRTLRYPPTRRHPPRTRPRNVYWDAGTARLLPRLIRDRTRGPVFVTHRRPGPGKYLADRDVCPDTGLARLSYDQARDLLDAATGTAKPRTCAATSNRPHRRCAS
ncbi:hypothetical protein [Nocardia cyriacigeorgica]|uniref:hypothetical protein n=1 Tax=Nocardia cyriacigeorgica TaxID=135487 RepID=UPI0024551EAE|nr:hypothetical protein [Nocardia cyriacigeorgica]